MSSVMSPMIISRSPISQLSQELIDMIVDTLALIVEEELEIFEMGNCALICRSFLSHSQRHLFSTIKIPGEGSCRPAARARRCEEFCKILDRSPHIVEYVREVHVALSSSDKSWVYEDSNFAALMEKIKQSTLPLQKLVIRGTAGLSKIGDTSALITRFFQPFISQFITSLSIRFINNIPIDMLTSCVNLKELGLIYSNLEMSTIQSQNSPRPLLETLEHYNSRAALAKVFRTGSNGSRSHLDFTTLRSLVIYTDYYEELEFEQELIDGTHDSLEELHLRIWDEQLIYSFKGFVNLHLTTHLRILETFSLFRNPGDEEDNLATICDVLSTIPKVNCLKTLRFTAHVGVIAKFVDPSIILDANWDLFLSEITRIALGKRFQLSLHVKYTLDWRGDEFKENTDEENDSDSQGAAGSTSYPRLTRPLQDLEDRCNRVVERLVREKFGLAERDPTIIFDSRSTLFLRCYEP